MLPKRKTIRLPDWDYHTPGYYFVTICTYERQCLFEDELFRQIATQTLLAIPQWPHSGVRLDEWVVMPNHLHVIFELTDNRIGLGNVIGSYKALVTRRIYNLLLSAKPIVWQRGYYERIVRNEEELIAVRKYILQNPERWQGDRDNLERLMKKMDYRDK